MNEPVTVRDVMTRAYVGVNEGDAVAGAARLITDEGFESAVVLRGVEPVGMLDARDIVAVVADDHDPETTTVGDAMTDLVTTIDADASLEEAVNVITSRDVRRLAVIDDGAVVGVLSEHDIVTAQSVLPVETADIEESALSTSRPAESPADGLEEFTAQSVCEVCGSLARELTHANGQLVCTDCRAI